VVKPALSSLAKTRFEPKASFEPFVLSPGPKPDLSEFDVSPGPSPTHRASLSQNPAKLPATQSKTPSMSPDLSPRAIMAAAEDAETEAQPECFSQPEEAVPETQPEEMPEEMPLLTQRPAPVPVPAPAPAPKSLGTLADTPTPTPDRAVPEKHEPSVEPNVKAADPEPEPEPTADTEVKVRPKAKPPAPGFKLSRGKTIINPPKEPAVPKAARKTVQTAVRTRTPSPPRARVTRASTRGGKPESKTTEVDWASVHAEMQAKVADYEPKKSAAKAKPAAKAKSTAKAKSAAKTKPVAKAKPVTKAKAKRVTGGKRKKADADATDDRDYLTVDPQMLDGSSPPPAMTEPTGGVDYADFTRSNLDFERSNLDDVVLAEETQSQVEPEPMVGWAEVLERRRARSQGTSPLRSMLRKGMLRKTPSAPKKDFGFGALPLVQSNLGTVRVHAVVAAEPPPAAAARREGELVRPAQDPGVGPAAPVQGLRHTNRRAVQARAEQRGTFTEESPGHRLRRARQDAARIQVREGRRDDDPGHKNQGKGQDQDRGGDRCGPDGGTHRAVPHLTPTRQARQARGEGRRRRSGEGARRRPSVGGGGRRAHAGGRRVRGGRRRRPRRRHDPRVGRRRWRRRHDPRDRRRGGGG
jgi:hypothetical protein